jgi:hypothetical protein
MAGLAVALAIAPGLRQASKAQDNAAEFCPDIHFKAYSTVEPGGQRVVESMDWDARGQAYVIRGPSLARLLDYPGVAEVPSGIPDAQAVFRLSISNTTPTPRNRYCQVNFYESAECTPHREILYTQAYTNCDQQTFRHVVRISAADAGQLLLLALSFADVRGQFDPPLYLAAGSDLRTSGCSIVHC